jgi:hypothetical protein
MTSRAQRSLAYRLRGFLFKDGRQQRDHPRSAPRHLDPLICNGRCRCGRPASAQREFSYCTQWDARSSHASIPLQAGKGYCHLCTSRCRRMPRIDDVGVLRLRALKRRPRRVATGDAGQ